MHLKSLAAAASLAVCGASAFLVPPEVTSSSETSAAGVLTIVPATASAQTLDLDCPGCPLVLEGRHGRFRVTNELVRSHLQLNFSVDHADGARDRLTVNGFELYPSSDPFKQALTAPHIPDFPAAASSSGRRRRHGARPLEPVLGFGLAVSPAQAVDEDAALELVQLDLQVFEVGGSFVTGLDNVRVRLVVAQGGALLMGALETTPTKTMAMPVPFAVPAGPTSVGADGKECTTMLCRLKAMVGDSVAHVKPWRHCGGKGAIDGIVKPGEEEQQEEAKLDETPQEHRNIDDELYKAQHTWTQLAKNIWSTILLPAFVGICIGILIGAVATCVGVIVSNMVIYLWRTFIRGESISSHSHRRHHRHTSSSAGRRAKRHSDEPPSTSPAPPADEEKAPLMTSEAEHTTATATTNSDDDDAAVPPPAYRD